MKKFSKILSVALLVALVLSLGVANAFAVDPAGTITIKNSEKDTTYNFYKIFDLSGTDTTAPTPDGVYDAVVYTVNDTWKSFVSTYLVAEDTNPKSLNPINVDGTVKYINITESNIVEFTNAAMEYAIHNNIAADKSAVGTGADLAVGVDSLGYYLMIPVDASLKTDKSSGSVASITSTVPNAEIQVKAVKPGIEKTDDTISADIGQTVTYTVKGTVPNTSGYETYKYIITDEMTEGLTFNKDVAIAVVTDATTTPVTTVAVTDATITNNTNGFTADINVFALQDYVGKEIRLTYTAVVNENAVKHSQEKNKVDLKYGHNPNQLEGGTPIEEEVYSAKVIINKFTGDATTGQKLAGAQFVLMNSEGKYYKYNEATATTPAAVSWVTVADAATPTTENVTDAMIANLVAADIDVKTTDTNGVAEFIGLKDGTYYLVEIVAPTGYNRLAAPQSVTVAGTDVDASNTAKTENVADGTGIFDSANNATADVQNNSGTALPSTGGIGTTIFYVVGGVLVLAAIILLVTKKRMSE